MASWEALDTPHQRFSLIVAEWSPQRIVQRTVPLIHVPPNSSFHRTLREKPRSVVEFKR
jgi:hypothetical protein